MNDVAATPTGGAEGQSRPQLAPKAAPVKVAPRAAAPEQAQPEPKRPQTVAERIKASMYAAPEPQEELGRAPKVQAESVPEELQEPTAPATAPDGDEAAPAEGDGQTDEAGAEGADGAEGAQEEPQAIKTVKELADGLGWDLDKVLDLEAPTKINGKDGKVALRDLLKSHQLEGHLNQKLMTLSEDRKAFDAETSRKVTEIQSRVQQLNQAVSLAEKILHGEYADVNWQDLQRTDPAAFQAKYGAFKMRQDGIAQLSQAVQQETELTQQSQAAAFKAYRDEQQKLLDSKLPEWSDKGTREKDVTEMVATLADAYGITEPEVRAWVDHRGLLMARDAVKWQKLQKSKPATLNKVRTAPKLIRPGSQQSRTSQKGLEFQKGQAQLRRTGKVQDAIPLLKQALFN
jgi:hypothetical protein